MNIIQIAGGLGWNEEHFSFGMNRILLDIAPVDGFGVYDTI